MNPTLVGGIGTYFVCNYVWCMSMCVSVQYVLVLLKKNIDCFKSLSFVLNLRQ